ncbi:MAG: LysM protein [Bacillota bacterium]|jgi:LysM repeat protein|nr:LysM protein [Bacillota bacterium]
MKKVLSIVLLVTLIFSVISFPALADDATSSATVTSGATASAPAPTTPAPTASAPVNTPVNAPSAPAGETYTVVSGDAFWKIAQKFNLTVDQLAKLNPQIKNINIIHVGDKIIVNATATTSSAPTTPAPVPTTTAPVATSMKLYHGFGEAANYRVRGESGTLNIATASVLFDENGKIVDLTWDVMEISKTLFPAWHEATQEQAAIDAFVSSVETWQTKRERGLDYDMTHLKAKGAADNASKKEWFEQLDFYEDYFKGMTVAEVEAWEAKYTDPVAHKPYKMAYPELLTDADKAVTATLTAEETAMLVDVTTSATMALEDGHSHLISALREAYEAREEVK